VSTDISERIHSKFTARAAMLEPVKGTHLLIVDDEDNLRPCSPLPSSTTAMQ
jgi:hypothetical protein